MSTVFLFCTVLRECSQGGSELAHFFVVAAMDSDAESGSAYMQQLGQVTTLAAGKALRSLPSAAPKLLQGFKLTPANMKLL